ncbi:MAG: helix-turn-helix domain-containing protein [Chitinivibrionales bacterium]|nr:helix-turn-helix domain-containing protein [Chitinivibrionales bacterium]
MELYILYMQKRRGPKKGTKFQGTHRYEFGKALATERIKRGLTQAELAERMESTVRVISHFEREVKNPPAETVKRLADALNIPVQRLLFPAKNNGYEEQSLDRGLSKRFEVAQKLPPSARQEVKKFIDAMAKANGVAVTTG